MKADFLRHLISVKMAANGVGDLLLKFSEVFSLGCYSALIRRSVPIRDQQARVFAGSTMKTISSTHPTYLRHQRRYLMCPSVKSLLFSSHEYSMISQSGRSVKIRVFFHGFVKALGSSRVSS